MMDETIIAKHFKVITKCLNHLRFRLLMDRTKHPTTHHEVIIPTSTIGSWHSIKQRDGHHNITKGGFELVC